VIEASLVRTLKKLHGRKDDGPAGA
jgi:hypothetical protein